MFSSRPSKHSLCSPSRLPSLCWRFRPHWHQVEAFIPHFPLEKSIKQERRNTWHASLSAIFILALTLFGCGGSQAPTKAYSSQSKLSTDFGTVSNPINALYVRLAIGSGNQILGNTIRENTLLKFIRDNGFNYLIFYQVQEIEARSTQATQLASFIRRAKTHYGIQQVGAALGAADQANTVIAYNNSHAFIERIDVLNLEKEYWKSATRDADFNDIVNILNSFKSVGLANNLETEVYVGWITAAEGIRLGDAADRILVHFYVKTDIDIIDYGQERLQYLASASKKVRVAPIFSNEGPTNTADVPFMGTWLETHPNEQALKSWMTQYNALNAPWKSNLQIMGSTWFQYTHFLDVNIGKPNHITTQPANQSACAGEAKIFAVTSSANAKSYYWMKDGKLLSDGGNISGARTASLTVSNISSADVGYYYARVVSSDASNPTSFASDAATLSICP